MNRQNRSPVFYACTFLLSIAFISPLVWALYSSFAPAPGTAQTDGFGLGNYRSLLSYGRGLPVYLSNSLIVSLVAVVLTVIVTTTAGYAFARFNFKGKQFLFILTLSVMMVPYAALLIPLLVWLSQINLNNSLVGVGLVLTLFQLPLCVFIMRNAFLGLPKELEEAAYIDGCNSFSAFCRILLPSVVPSVVTVALFTYLAAWNDFLVSLYLVSMDNAPLPLALVNMRQQTMGVIDYGATTAGVVILSIPAVILFLALQKYYVRGFTSGAVKG